MSEHQQTLSMSTKESQIQAKNLCYSCLKTNNTSLGVIVLILYLLNMSPLFLVEKVTVDVRDLNLSVKLNIKVKQDVAIKVPLKAIVSYKRFLKIIAKNLSF